MEYDPCPVKMCVCFNIPFAQLKAMDYPNMDSLQAESRCGTQCGTCLPYIELMLETGKTEFPVLPQ